MLLLNQHNVNYTYFSGGEINVTLPEVIKEERVKLTWKPCDPQSIVLLMMTVSALKEAGISDIDLDILYLPYARQDRVCRPGEAFGLKVIANFINALDVSTVRLWDVHNPALTDDLFAHNYVWHWEALDIFDRYKILDDFDLDNLILCAPDAGAIRRVDKVVQHFELQTPCYLDKRRNPTTGSIVSIQLSTFSRPVDCYNVMIVDDICDGGATFIQSADVLKKAGAEKLYLYITHGIFRNGLEELLEHFEHIYCHHVLDDYHFHSTDRFTILKEFPIVS
jgi:ribose-phosphate pyrophosphokinase